MPLLTVNSFRESNNTDLLLPDSVYITWELTDSLRMMELELKTPCLALELSENI